MMMPLSSRPTRPRRECNTEPEGSRESESEFCRLRLSVSQTEPPRRSTTVIGHAAHSQSLPASG
eukprot:1671051-Rhodomonas_salina.1